MIWKYPPPEVDNEIARVGGRATKRSGLYGSGPENANHYADIDIAVEGDTTWRNQCLQNDALIDPEIWLNDFYLR